MVIYAVIGTKGGIGKTTLSAHFGSLVAAMGLRVLLVDVDIQASLSKFFVLKDKAELGITSIFQTGMVSEQAISTTVWPGLDIILSDAPERAVSSGDGSDLERLLQNRMDLPMILYRALHSPLIEELYDLVVIDTPGV